ncbi:MAG: LysR family transcriptional regulator [Lachnospiraceae bacterium]|nr:LysR family transcriptional regulator [Lachnospiraceae bacterium]
MNYRKLIDLRQIECFAACAQTGSISKAAEMLHMSQPSVSKAIKAMEDTLEVRLFQRYAKGILLTEEGESVYQYVKNIMDNLREMQEIHTAGKTDTLHVSANPSSWFADMFLEFYTEHQEEKLHYEVVSAGTHDIVRRLQERIDDIGFVYVIKNQRSAFSHYLMRNYLEFTDLAQTSVVVFSKSGNNETGLDGGASGLSGLRLVQRFPDEFSPDNYWDIIDTDGHSVEAAETVVTTNSDYLMSRLLESGNLSNISAAYLTEPQKGVVEGIPIAGLKEDRIIFGYIKRRGEELPAKAEAFMKFIKHKLK